MRKTTFLFFTGCLLALFYFDTAKAQLPENVLVGYHENWNTLKLTEIHENYNVVCLAFALPVNAPEVGYDIRYSIPYGYTGTAEQKKAAFMADIDALHADGKVVLLSLGGATGPIMLSNTTERDVFVNSVNDIFAEYEYKIDGIDLDLESSSMAFESSWTISSPAAGQTNMIQAVKSIMANYQSVKGEKMILTAAPEVVYVMGGLSAWQITNTNGGAFLPILDGLRDELDLLHMQLYNAGGNNGGVFAWDNTIYYDNGTPDFALAMNESIIKGFTCVNGKGTFTGLPAEKLAFGFPATSSSSTAGTGYVDPVDICSAVKYFKGETSKPEGVSYTMSSSYPELKGLMTWSVNEDAKSIDGSWDFANNYTCSFPATLTGVNSSSEEPLPISVYPNPTSQNTTLEISLDYVSEVTLKVTDISGNVIYSIVSGKRLGKGKHRFNCPEGLPANIYYVNLIINDKHVSTSFVKVN